MSELDQLLDEGLACEKQGDLVGADSAYRRAVELDRRCSRAYFRLGRLHWSQGRRGSAILFLRKAVDEEPRDADAQAMLAVALHESGRLDEALHSHRIAISLRPDSSDFHFNFANALEDADRLEDSAAVLNASISLEPNSADAWSNLGRVLHRLDRADEALAACEQAISIDPSHAPAWNNRAALLKKMGRWEESAASYQRAVELAPADPDSQRNLGLTLVGMRQFPKGLAALQLAAELRPHSAEILADLAGVLREVGVEEEAVERYRQAVAIDPTHQRAWRNLADVLASVDQIDQAKECYEHLSTLAPRSQLWPFVAECCLCPIVFSDRESMVQYRRSLDESLDRWRGVRLTDDWRELVEARCIPPFALDHHGLDERPTREKYAAVFSASLPTMEPPARGSGRPKLAVLATDGHEGVFVRSFAGVFDRFQSPELETTILSSSAGCQRIRRGMKGDRVRFLALPACVEDSIRMIRDERFDLLYFWEVGTDAWNYFLPCFRLAAAQCTSFGIQSTTGIPAMDVYLSSRALEPAGAQSRYTERLDLLDHLPAYVRRQPAPSTLVSRSSLGLDDSSNLYVCPQRLAKIHPDFDELAANILRQDPKGLIILSAGRIQRLTDRLVERFRRRLPDVCDRIRFMPEPRGDSYYSLLCHASVVLDTVHYGGVNTTYDSFAMGKAIVTTPSDYQRGRFAAGCYSQMGMHDVVCADADRYVEQAVRIAGEKDYGRELESRIVKSRDVLYENAGMAQELENWFLEEIHRVRKC